MGMLSCKITLSLQDPQNFAAGHKAGLSHAVGVSEQVSNDRGGHTLLGHLADVVCDLHSHQVAVRRREGVSVVSTPGRNSCGTSAEVIFSHEGGDRL